MFHHILVTQKAQKTQKSSLFRTSKNTNSTYMIICGRFMVITCLTIKHIPRLQSRLGAKASKNCHELPTNFHEIILISVLSVVSV